MQPAPHSRFPRVWWRLPFARAPPEPRWPWAATCRASLAAGTLVASAPREEVEVLGGPGGQVLGDQGGVSGEEEALSRGQEKKSCATRTWKSDRAFLRRRTRRSLGHPLESGGDDLGPGGTNISGENKGVPQVDKEGAVDVGKYVCGGALAEHDLVYAGPLIAVAELELPVGLGPVQVQGKGDSGHGLAHGQSGQAGRHECGATAGEGSFRKLDLGHRRQLLPGRGEEPGGGLHGGGGAPVFVCRQRGSGGARTDGELALR